MKSNSVHAVLLLLVLFCTGCSPRLNDEKSVDLVPQFVQKYATPSPLRELTVTFQADSEPVSVYVVDSANEAREVESLSNGTAPTVTLGKKEKEKSGEITVTVPEKRNMSILIVCEKKTRLKVKMAGK